ncbi:MAG: hypothetical protein ABEL76_04005, partial [Bradymonadaceae bacterium]
MHWLTKFLLVALGGALGASSRTGLASLVASSFQGGAIAPAAIGTLAVNLVGCLGMGFGRAAAAASGWGTPEMQALVFS